MQSTTTKNNYLLQIYGKIQHKMSAVITTLESTNSTNTFATFIACMFIRNFLESFTQRTNVLLDHSALEVLGNTAHFDASFIALALMLTLLMHYMTRTPIISVIKAVFPCFIIILFAPIIDLIASHGKGMNLAYLSPDENLDLLTAYLTFFGKFAGATPGIRAEVAISMIGIYFYTLVKTRSATTSLAAAFLSYTLIFLWGASPYIVKPLTELFGIQYSFSGLNFLRYFLVLNFLLTTWVLYLADKKCLTAFIAEIPWLRVLHYEAMFLFGICLAFNTSITSIKYQYFANPALLGNGILLMIAIFLALLSAMVTNNLADTEIDKISSPTRLLVSSKIQITTYQTLAWIFLACSLLYAALPGIHAVLCMLVIISSYYLYSVPPLRLKRIPIFSKLVISGNSLVLMILGFWFVHGNISDFPKQLYWIILGIFTLAANFIDLKDLRGDEAVGIKTLPVIVGMRAAQWFCAIAFVIAYFAFYIAFRINGVLLITLGLAALLQIWFLTKKIYHESPVFVIYLGSVFLLMGHLIGFDL